MKLSILHRYTLVCLTALISCACSSEPDPADASSTATTTTGGLGGFCDPKPFMERACSGVVCHGTPGKPAMYNTDLINPPTGQTLAQSLINKPANYALIVNPAACPTGSPELLINPTTPSESLILKKMMGTHACGEKMPNSDKIAVTQGDIDCMVSWVDGAITAAGLTVTNGGTPSTTGSATTASVTTTGTTSGTSTTMGTSTTGAPLPATWDSVRQTINYSTIVCAGSDCHGGFEGRLNLQDDAGLYGRLTTWTSELCGNKLVVSPGNPDQSAIIDVLTTGCGAVAPNCLVGEECIPQMPVNCQPGFDCISPEKIEDIRQWIAAGAVGPQ